VKSKSEIHREWYQRNKEKVRPYKAANMRRYRAADPEKYRIQSREHKKLLRDKLLEMYGRKCAICGFDDRRALTLDHINQNGNSERKELGERGVYRRALKEYNPDEYRTLCMNCQFIERQKCFSSSG
jgi:5-methylcytosine-specific restriction endonuclease McrA